MFAAMQHVAMTGWFSVDVPTHTHTTIIKTTIWFGAELVAFSSCRFALEMCRDTVISVCSHVFSVSIVTNVLSAM